MNSISFQNKKEGPKVIKKYGNRKLYDTEQSSYVILKDIEKMVRNKEEIQIIDNETKDDITIPTLTQIIFSSEKKSKISAPLDILKSIIREGDGSFSSFLSRLGLFTSNTDECENTNPDLYEVLAVGNKSLVKNSQNIEQKITSLMTSDDELRSTNHKETAIPELPGNRL